MTAKEKQEAFDKKIDMLIRAGWQCFKCKKHLRLSEAQLAHKIPKKKMYLQKYGPEIIHHPLNMEVSCADCNSYALVDPAANPIEAQEIVDKIEDYFKFEY